MLQIVKATLKQRTSPHEVLELISAIAYLVQCRCCWGRVLAVVFESVVIEDPQSLCTSGVPCPMRFAQIISMLLRFGLAQQSVHKGCRFSMHPIRSRDARARVCIPGSFCELFMTDSRPEATGD